MIPSIVQPSRIPLRALSLLAALLLVQAGARGADNYELGPDSQRQPGVPEGKVSKFHWTSQVFPGTERDCWTYVPAQYNSALPACVMVFQDGGGYVDVEKGSFRVPIVFD